MIGSSAFAKLQLNEARRLCLSHCFRLFDDVECETFNFFSHTKAEISWLFLFTKCFIKHCVTIYPEPSN